MPVSRMAEYAVVGALDREVEVRIMAENPCGLPDIESTASGTPVLVSEGNEAVNVTFRAAS